MNEEILELINQNKNIEELKCNRNNLNKVIKWSSSKYNEYTKVSITFAKNKYYEVVK